MFFTGCNKVQDNRKKETINNDLLISIEPTNITDSISIGWEFELSYDTDNYDIPITKVYLIIEGDIDKKEFVGEYTGILENCSLNNDSWEYPENSIIKCFGWYAGAGDLLCVVRNEPGVLSVKHKAISEGCEDLESNEIVEDIFHEVISIRINDDTIIQAKAYQEVKEENVDSIDVSMLINGPSEIELYPLYFDGLKNNDPIIRWYSCNRMIDYYSHMDKHNEIEEELRRLLNDTNDSVKISAEFVLSIYENRFDGNSFYPSPNNKYIAFYNFRETRYNDGVCRIYMVDKDEIYTCTFQSITGMQWSPDSNVLCIHYGGRVWSDISFIDLRTKTTYTPGIHEYLYENKDKYEYLIGNWERPNPTTHLVDWSPNMEKVLLSYSFIDDNMVGQTGLCEYDFKQAKIVRIIKLGEFHDDHPVIEVPDDFQW